MSFSQRICLHQLKTSSWWLWSSPSRGLGKSKMRIVIHMTSCQLRGNFGIRDDEICGGGQTCCWVVDSVPSNRSLRDKGEIAVRCHFESYWWLELTIVFRLILDPREVEERIWKAYQRRRKRVFTMITIQTSQINPLLRVLENIDIFLELFSVLSGKPQRFVSTQLIRVKTKLCCLHSWYHHLGQRRVNQAIDLLPKLIFWVFV